MAKRLTAARIPKNSSFGTSRALPSNSLAKLPTSDGASSCDAILDISSHIRRIEAVLLPTVCAILERPDKSTLTVRCLLNTGCAYSIVHSPLVESAGFHTHSVDDETLCRLRLESIYDSKVVSEHLFRLENIDLVTPTYNISSACAEPYRNVALGDPSFYKSDSVDIIIGMDLYNRLLLTGNISHAGHPDAINTIFGYAISGTFSQ